MITSERELRDVLEGVFGLDVPRDPIRCAALPW
jgi:hypothetical protein